MTRASRIRTASDLHAAATAFLDRQDAMITRYYTFGYDHAHAVDGFTYDKDVVVKITAADPRAVMLETFGCEWSMEYTLEQLDLSRYPRGVVELPVPPSYADRIRAGLVAPWIPADTEAEGARRSAQVAREELDMLAADAPRREEIQAQAQAWADRAAALEAAS